MSRGGAVVCELPVVEVGVEAAGPQAVVGAGVCGDASDRVGGGIGRARHRNSSRYEELITPGQIYEFEIDLWETCIAFNAGHRIRVSLSSSNHDRFDVNPNTGEPWNQHTHMQSATNTIYHDAQHPSHILLRVTSDIPEPPEFLPAVSWAGGAALTIALALGSLLYMKKRRRLNNQ